MTPAELRALLAKATPGPWVAETDWFDCANEGIEVNIVSPGAQACFRSFPIDGTKFGSDDEAKPWTEDDAAKKRAAEEKAKASQELSDARLLAGAGNALPALLDVVKRIEEASRKNLIVHEVDGEHRCISGCGGCAVEAALAKLETP